MFGMSLIEILLIAVIAIIFLGPEKLPSAMVDIAKFFKSFKNTIGSAKESLEQEIKLQELKDDALSYKKKIEKAATDIKKDTSAFEELEEIKSTTKDITRTLNDIEHEVEDDLQQAKDETNADDMDADEIDEVEVEETTKEPEKIEEEAKTKKDKNDV